MLSIQEAYDLIRFAELALERLSAVADELEAREGHAAEKSWLASARALVADERSGFGPLLARIRTLPEMSAAREEHAVAQIGPWVDALEKLLAGITFHFGSRSPVIEALYPHLKLPLLRRPNLDEIRAFWSEFERRLRSAYVARIFAQDDWGFARDVAEQIRVAWAPIGAAELAAPPSEEERRATLAAARAQGERLERVLAQARLLAEAALLPFEGLFASSGLALKPKRRAARVEGLALEVPEPAQIEAPQRAETEAAEPETAEPEAAEPEAAEPETAQLEAAEPETAEAGGATPATAELEAAEPETAELESAEPETAEPEAAEPETAEAGGATPATAEVAETETAEAREPETAEVAEPELEIPELELELEIPELADVDSSRPAGVEAQPEASAPPVEETTPPSKKKSRARRAAPAAPRKRVRRSDAALPADDA